MKTGNVLLIAMLSIMAQVSIGQNLNDIPNPVRVLSSEDIFRQGVWNFNLNEYISLHSGNTREEGEKTGTFSNFGGMVEANYFVVDHFGVGAGMGYSRDVTKVTEFDPGSVERIEVLGGHFNALYGNKLGGVVNIITKASVGMGKRTSVTDYGYGEYETKYNFLRWRISVGTPIEINRNVYFTPSIGYNYVRYKNDEFRETRNSFNVGLNMDFFMGCGDDQCDLSKNPFSLSSRYQQKEIQLGSRMFGSFQVGNQKTIYEGEEEMEQKDGFGMSRLSGYALYYVINNLAVGAGLDYCCDRTNSKDIEYKTRQSELTFNPIVQYHVPVNNMLRNLYGEGSVGFGFNNSMTDDGSEVSKNNATVFNWKIGAGYNYIVSEHFSLSPMFGYGSQSLKYKNNDLKTANGGMYAGVGWNFHLR